MSDIFSSILPFGELDIVTFLKCMLAALACGALTALAAGFRTHSSRSFLVSLVLLPLIVATVIIMVNGNIGTGVAVMGAFSLIRFRSVPGKARDIVAIFLAMTAGLTCATGYVGFALVLTLAAGLIMMLLTWIPMGEDGCQDLHITIPESLRYANEFDDLFKQYTKAHRLVRARTTNMGSLYKLDYRIQMKNRQQTQEFIDALRCRNGNLEISIAEISDAGEVL